MKLLSVLITGLLAAAGAHAQGAAPNDQVSHFTAADGTSVTLTSGQPADRSYGPRPAFEQLDVDRDGMISREEAEAYLPLFNDFDNLAHHVPGISKRAYARWDQR